MAGHFYQSPPTFIGGRQPYAPPLGQVQSAPAPSNPPPINRASWRIIEARYRDDPWTIIHVCSIAPALQTPATPDNPPPRSYANQRLISGLWDIPSRPLPLGIKVAPLLPAPAAPDNAPIKGYVTLGVVTRQWDPPYRPLPSGSRFAPLLPVADNPPRFSYAIRNTILSTWVPPYRPIPRLQISEIVTEVVSDTTPNAFSFADQIGVAQSVTITSDPITVTGINAAATISVTGGTYDINGSGSFTSSAGTVNNGDTVRARHTSSASYGTATNTIVTIGGVSDTFTSTTPAAVQEIVPYLIGDTQEAAEMRIESICCVASVIGTTGTVTAQDPAAFTYVDRGTTITITLGGAVNSSRGRRRRGQVPYNSIQ